jgi:GT2 family glycosyltransferase
MKNPKASIIILDYLKSKRVTENVKSILEQITNFEYEVIVVDNSANPDNARKLEQLREHPSVKVVINDKNIGYVRGNNRGVSESRGEYILIVNPDILWNNADTLQKLINHMDSHPEVGVLAPRQISDRTGRTEMTVRAFPRLTLQIARRTGLRDLPVLRDMVARDECQHLDYTKNQSVDWIQSSFWVTRRSLWDKLGGLDNRYFIFMSDPDYCFKVWQAGYKVIYFPEVTVRADGRRASEGGLKDFFVKPILRQHFKDAVKYRIAHFGKKNPRKTHYYGKITNCNTTISSNP